MVAHPISPPMGHAAQRHHRAGKGVHCVQNGAMARIGSITSAQSLSTKVIWMSAKHHRLSLAQGEARRGIFDPAWHLLARSLSRGRYRMHLVYERCAGLDLHKKSVVACAITPDE